MVRPGVDRLVVGGVRLRDVVSLPRGAEGCDDQWGFLLQNMSSGGAGGATRRVVREADGQGYLTCNVGVVLAHLGLVIGYVR